MSFRDAAAPGADDEERDDRGRLRASRRRQEQPQEEAGRRSEGPRRHRHVADAQGGRTRERDGNHAEGRGSGQGADDPRPGKTVVEASPRLAEQRRQEPEPGWNAQKDTNESWQT